ncbi:hypothetical protein GGE09_003607 [Roseobacter sp. N2S]|nr:hypothetical protein [Roseobacter sp. N2S]
MSRTSDFYAKCSEWRLSALCVDGTSGLLQTLATISRSCGAARICGSFIHNAAFYQVKRRSADRSTIIYDAKMRRKLGTLAYCFEVYFELITDVRRQCIWRTDLLAKRIVRGAVFGAIVAASITFLLVLTTSGNGEDWSFLSEQQFQGSYPELDYFSVYLVPSISKLAVQTAIWGSIIGAVISLITWAFSSNREKRE